MAYSLNLFWDFKRQSPKTLSKTHQCGLLCTDQRKSPLHSWVKSDFTQQGELLSLAERFLPLLLNDA